MTNEVEINVNKACPHCAAELTPEEIKSLWSSYTTSLRTTLGGPKRVSRPCPTCGMVCTTAREAWNHCRIPRNLDPAALLAYVLDQMPKEIAGLMSSRYSRSFTSLETLQTAVGGILETKLKPAQKRQAKWYAGYIERAVDKLEDVA